MKDLSETELLDIFAGVPQFDLSRSDLIAGLNIVDLLAVKSQIFASKGEARRLIQGGGINVNKQKITTTETTINDSHLLEKKYILIQKGKKNYYLLKLN